MTPRRAQACPPFICWNESSPLRYLVFIDYWNFQLNWNHRRDPGQRCDYGKLPGMLISEAVRVVGAVESNTGTASLVETRLYASADSQGDQQLKNWLINTVNRMPSYRVDVRTRRTQAKPVFCRNCRTKTELCPSCSQPFVRSAEKGVDAAIVTDMLLSGRKGLMDVAVIVSSDADLVPAVFALSDDGIRTINATWRGQGYELARRCWGSFDLDDILQRIVIQGHQGRRTLQTT